MGIVYEDAVVIKEAQTVGSPTEVTVNCPDKTGLGCDLCRIILLFGLSICRGDFQTDGKWCYIVFWVVGNPTTNWSLLKKRLLEVCPSHLSTSGLDYYQHVIDQPKSADVFLLKFWCHYDGQDFLHDVTGVLRALELTIKRVKVSTAPDGKVMDLFYITDTRELLHTKERQQDTISHLSRVLGNSLINCEIELAGPVVTSCSQGLSVLQSAISEDMFMLELPNKQPNGLLASYPVSVKVDNSLSPAHTVIQIMCRDHKGLIYDTMRTLKDYNIQVSYGRFTVNKGNCELELFIMQQADKKKIIDPSKQAALCSRLRMELARPLRVRVISRGPDTELLVSNPVELSGRGRPLVFHDVTLALKDLNICTFSVEIWRHVYYDREWEVYRILLDESRGNPWAPNKIEDCVRNKLMGWN
uniref:ACT domain-containing protein ACR n=1 Tax=Kalanchoe fedtschenkoi TaxID=63787 RepID=A0A7N0T6L2_KALFE